MTVWRLCRRGHAAFDGEGSRLFGGRWSHPGVAVIYTSATASLAALEYLVHVTPAGAPRDLVLITAEIPTRLEVTTVDDARLPQGWRAYPAPEARADIGTNWARSCATAVLQVPSAVVPQESNYLLNPAHRDFGQIRIGAPARFSFDPRLSSVAQQTRQARRPRRG